MAAKPIGIPSETHLFDLVDRNAIVNQRLLRIGIRTKHVVVVFKQFALKIDRILGHQMSRRQTHSEIFGVHDFLACRLMAVHKLSYNRDAHILDLLHKGHRRIWPNISNDLSAGRRAPHSLQIRTFVQPRYEPSDAPKRQQPQRRRHCLGQTSACSHPYVAIRGKYAHAKRGSIKNSARSTCRCTKPRRRCRARASI